MAEPKTISPELLERIRGVTNLRARFVLDRIAKNGIITTEEINHAGYEHPPRAVRDARELGFAIKTIQGQAHEWPIDSRLRVHGLCSH